ncbi:MAG: transcriptional regulator [Hyphomicrobiales bacterium]|nr:transcriptional regulator [Hyphomicrobiales bacterium]MCP5000871.1 transcriptional regulator [Hyphomicrobiales bacterium]
MSIHHHLDDASLMRYASGDLDPAFCVIVASHLAMCGQCRNAVRLAEAVGGDCLGQTPQATVSDDAFARLSQMIDAEAGRQPEKPVAVQDPAGQLQSNVPLPLQHLIGGSLDDLNWRWIVPGVHRHRIELASTDSSLFMLRIGPGRKMPEHGHGGTEMTLVLSGSYKDAIGRFGPGDITDLDEHIEHQPSVDSQDPCICLVATEEPTQFKGLVSRLMQPLVGI